MTMSSSSESSKSKLKEVHGDVYSSPSDLQEIIPHQKLDMLKNIFSFLECNCCGKKLSSRRALIRHVQLLHPEKIEKQTRRQKVIKTYECNSCYSTFSTRRSIIRHWKRFHSNPISLLPEEKTWDCNECSKKYTNKFSLYKHRGLCHSNSAASMERNLKKAFECDDCGRNYSFKRALCRHIQASHPAELSRIMISKPFVCSICGKRYARSRGHTLHMKREHTGEAPIKRSTMKIYGYDCPICSMQFNKKPAVLKHFSEDHNIDMVSETMEFETRADFDEWRMRLEEETRNNYVTRSSYTSSNSQLTVFLCSRSGYYTSESTGKRILKMKGTRKINGYCPATIHLRITADERCHVHFTSTHVGHSNDMAHVRLNTRERQMLREALDKDESVGSILHKFKISNSERLRLNFLRDPNNINGLTSMNGQGPLSEQNPMDECDDDLKPAEAANIQSWVDRNKDALLYAKCAGVEDPAQPVLSVDDFAFVVMTAEQRTKLAGHANDVVCVRRFWKPKKYNFHVTALLVIVHEGLSYAGAFFISNRDDVIMYQVLLRFVIREVPALKPRILIGPVSEPFYAAWVQETGNVPEWRLHCLRELLPFWKSYLRPYVKNRKTQKEMRNLMNQLAYETDESKFSHSLDALKAYLEGEDRFRQFFEKYMSSVNNWAYCRAGVNPNDVLETFYDRFNGSWAGFRTKIREDGDKEQEVDSKIKSKFLWELLEQIRILINRQEYQQSMFEEWGLAEQRLKKLRIRHRQTTYDFENVLDDESGTRWLVMSSRFKDVDVDGNAIYSVYVVEKVEKNCVDCKFVCTLCAACMHDYKCSCPDAQQRGNMCSHIHLVCQFIARKQPLGGNDRGAENLVEISPHCLEEPSGPIRTLTIPSLDSHDGTVVELKEDTLEDGGSFNVEESLLITDEVVKIEEKVILNDPVAIESMEYVDLVIPSGFWNL